MSKKLLFKIVLGVGLVELLLLTPYAVQGVNFQLIIFLTMFIPVVLVSFLWKNRPTKSWLSSLLYTWIIFTTFILVYALYFIVTDSEILWNIAVSFLYAFIYGTAWTAILMLPVGLIYLITRKHFQSTKTPSSEL